MAYIRPSVFGLKPRPQLPKVLKLHLGSHIHLQVSPTVPKREKKRHKVKEFMPLSEYVGRK